MKKVIHSTISTIIMSVVVAAFLSVASAYADNDTSVTYSTMYIPGVTDYTVDTGDGVTLDVNVAPVNALEITLSRSNLAIDLTPKVGTAAFGNDTLNILVGTTNKTGYTLTMEPSYNDVSTTSLTRTESINAVVPTIDTIDFATPADTFASTSDTDTMNRWGYLLGTTNLDVDKTIYNPILVNNTINMTNTAVSNHPSSVTFAAKANTELPAGNYRATLKFMAVTNYVPMQVTDLTYMQDFTTLNSVERAEVLGSMTVNEQYQLKDSRDNKKYWISKLETSCSNPRAMKETDGSSTTCYQIWMTENLDLDLETTASSVAALTNLNTDINTCNNGIYTTGYSLSGTTCTWTPSVATVDDVANTSNQQTTPQSLDVGAVYYYPGTTAGENGEQPASCPTNENCNHYLAGNYYNWTAAVASNNSASQTTDYTNVANSICPAGWGLPSGLTAANGYSDFGYLLVQHSITSSFGGISWSTNGYSNIQKAPLYTTRSGGFGGGGFYNQASHGYLWSGTTISGTGAYFLLYDSSRVYPAVYDNRYNGFPVRCLLRPTIDDLTEMQDFASLTSDQKSYILASMDTSTASTPVSYRLKDNRDGKSYWISKLRTDNSNPRGMISTDGNKYQIWMTQNLDLDLETTPNKVAALTNKNTDINACNTGIYTDGYSLTDEICTFTPERATATAVNQTTNSLTDPYSLDVGTSTYYYPGDVAGTNGETPASCVANSADCEHWNAGNYYNWSAAVASNNTTAQTTDGWQSANSLCPAGWRLPSGITVNKTADGSTADSVAGSSDIGYLLVQHGITSSFGTAGAPLNWNTDGYVKIQSSPLYTTRSGYLYGGSFYDQASGGDLWSGTTNPGPGAYSLSYGSSNVYQASNADSHFGFPVRCLAR